MKNDPLKWKYFIIFTILLFILERALSWIILQNASQKEVNTYNFLNFIPNSLIIAIIIISLILIAYFAFSKSPQIQFSLSLIEAGLIGHLLDRILFNGALDFIPFFNFLINISDIYITLGIIISIISIIRT